jgi:NAD(P)-dependent dehydrogenase (short-subunit alcohol dehydrogenase family)
MTRLAPTDKHRTELTRNLPLGRWASKDEIADLAIFLSSDAARNITGTLIVTDGGYAAGRV